AKITKFTAGYCTHISCMTTQGTGFNVCKFPAGIFLLSVNNHLWLWDTGYSNHFMDATRNNIFAIYRKTTPVYFNLSERIVTQLQEQGITGQDLKGIILSHYHGDHIAGLKDFPNVPIICSGQGWQQLKPKKGFAALRKAFVPELMPDDFEQRAIFHEGFQQIALPAELQPFTTVYILPDSNNEIILVDLPGHAEGHIGAFVLTENGWELIAADAAWTKANYHDLKMPSKLANLIMADSQQFK